MPADREGFESRRRRFMEAIGPDAIAIFAAAPESVRSNDVEHRYRQNSDLYYLTGFPEPDAVCVLRPGHENEEFTLFVRPRDPDRETWTGRRAGVDGAIGDYGASMAYPVQELEEKIVEMIGERQHLYSILPGNGHFNPRLLSWLERAQRSRPRTGSGPTSWHDARPVLHEMRLQKDESEIVQMRRAAEISAAAHRAAMRRAAPGVWEYELEALIDAEFRRCGAAGPAYPTIVASGDNATILHYTTNDRCMRDGDFLLIDAGAEYDYHCADITRTFPVGTRFEGRARAVYEVVLRAQEAAIRAVRPGVRFDDVHMAAVRELVDGLLDLRLLSGRPEDVVEKEEYRPYFMHRTSHWLGMDVHDVGVYRVDGESRVLEPDMVLTIEPGIYISDRIENVGEEWHGIGVRIEDDVRVTRDGHEVLTAAVPKQIEAVEELRRSG